MKFSLVAALVVLLAVAHGSEAVSLVKRDAQSEVDKITDFLKEMSASITSSTQDVVEKLKALEVTNTAQTYIKDGQAKIQPLVDNVQAEAAKLQEQVKPYITNIDDKITPLTDDLHDQVKPLVDMMLNLFQQVVNQTNALLPPQ
ncbi:type-4 ice-structuring protein LS-12 [Limanda limanda]|uniref:type-4 ice-structuring protein LS-12 n=1 Tax=Limanda limanda TaxID=27771 RepID=UPI0029C9A369|nr:type-4 ice-structuring protein LS-12 [Limanda limanda]